MNNVYGEKGTTHPYHHYSSETLKLKLQYKTTSHPPKWLNFKKLIAPNFVDDVEKWELL